MQINKKGNNLLTCYGYLDLALSSIQSTAAAVKEFYRIIQSSQLLPEILILKRPVPLLPLLSTLNLTNVTLSLSLLQSSQVSNKPPPADSELSCTYCG